jgi:hypothetical protein
MKLAVRKPVTKKFARLAVVIVAVVATVAYLTTIAAEAATHNGSGARLDTRQSAASRGWHLRLSVAPGITSVAICEYGAFRYGDDCTLWLGYSDKQWQTLTPTGKAYTGHIAVIWNPAEFNVNPSADFAYATPGHWNQCELPAGSGTLHITAENSLPNCD